METKGKQKIWTDTDGIAYMTISEAKARCNDTAFRVVDNSGCNAFGYDFAVIKRTSRMLMTNTVPEDEVLVASHDVSHRPMFDRAAVEAVLRNA